RSRGGGEAQHRQHVRGARVPQEEGQQGRDHAPARAPVPCPCPSPTSAAGRVRGAADHRHGPSQDGHQPLRSPGGHRQ
ncbi:hypothetical protein ACJX0J_012422, partial [Zea mays]